MQGDNKPSILIFDEATSALDNCTQAIFTKSLDRLHATQIIIVHRLSMIRNCDRILVIDAGKIVESGGDYLFCNLYDAQRDLDEAVHSRKIIFVKFLKRLLVRRCPICKFDVIVHVFTP